uniref:helix-turn-helix domain-containing protein n=1 Tax=Psychrobacter sp. TaxID=56811 RepID=UPI00159B81A8|nr:helix-turn-helix domain-containing protein [Psychrobacter sp.]QJS05787.1 transcriptional regulator protein, MarR family [Psychrobacter sp.]
MKSNSNSNSIVDKWGETSCSLGWVAIPTLLLFSQKELSITASEMNILMNLVAHWWEKSKKPFPSQGAIAYRTGLSIKTVQRSLGSLEKKGLISKTPTPRSNFLTRGRNMYDLSPLVSRLSEVSEKVLEDMTSRKNMVTYDGK